MHALAAHVTCRKAVTAGLLTALLGACSANPAGEPTAAPPARSAPEPAAPATRITGSTSAPAADQPQSPAKPIPCPSQDFEEFLKAFANRGDVRLAYSNQPFKSTAPYYWAHNTRPGDPRYPKWESELAYGVPSAKFRYDSRNGVYVWNTDYMRSDEAWSPEDASKRTPVLKEDLNNSPPIAGDNSAT